jgi:hexosaminidase
MKKTKLIFLIALSLNFYITAIGQNGMTIIPKPNKFSVANEKFQFTGVFKVYSNESESFNRDYLKSKIENFSKCLIESNAEKANLVIDLNKSYNIVEEGYKLIVEKERIIIKSSSKSGVFYGIQSLLQLFPDRVYSGSKHADNKVNINVLDIEDSPEFSYRGMMLDVSRTFFSKKIILNYIDWLSYHKINKFHWHLTDDNGWRIEIKKYPLLTSKGAWRGENEVLPAAFGSGKERNGGYYTQNDVKEIVKYASDRNIEIIPEIDLPGHSKAVTATYPEVLCSGKDHGESVQGEKNNVWCVGNEKNYKMLDDIIKELSKLFPSKYIHIGGDEVNTSSWEKCSLCGDLMKENGFQKSSQLLGHFVKRLEKIANKYGKNIAGWDEILEEKNLDPNTIVYAWRSINKGFESARRAQPTVMMPGAYCYFDMKQSPAERGHNWAGIVTLEKAYSFVPHNSDSLKIEDFKYVIGVQGALWTELLQKPENFIDYQLFPRMLAIAEVGWTSAKNKNYNEFYKIIEEKHYSRMFEMGIAFRIPYPTAKFENNKISVSSNGNNSLITRYTIDGTEPNSYSPIYNGEIYTDNPFKFKFRNFYKDQIKSISVGVSNVEYVFQKPSTSIISSIKDNEKFSFKNLTDYNFNSYSRSIGRVVGGDYLIYMFDNPVDSKKITIDSGIPNIDFYYITDGNVEISYDGSTYVKAGNFVEGKCIIYPNEKIKAVKINITASNDGHILCLQDLRIE